MLLEPRHVILSILTFSFLTFTALFGRLPVFRRTPIGFLYRAIWIHIPRYSQRLDHVLTGGALGSSAAKLGRYLLHEKHPLVVLFFLSLLVVSEAIFIPAAWPRLHTIDRVLTPLICALPYYFLYRATYTDPGIITKSNHSSAMRLYPYDYTLYYPGVGCTTCHMLKPARSKHCRICNRCISRSDHHCAWINNCVGHSNHHFFLLLLLSISILTLYGSYLGYLLTSTTLRDGTMLFRVPPMMRSPHPYPGHDKTAMRNWISTSSWLEYFDMWGSAIMHDKAIGAVGLLCFMSTPLVLGLLSYHLYLVWAGTTINESAKWADRRADMADGLVFKARLSQVRGTCLATAAVSSQTSTELGPDAPREEEADPPVEWPVSIDQFLLVTKDGKAPTTIAKSQSQDEGVLWDRIWDLSEVENLYDLGFWPNLVMILTGVVS